MSRKSAVKTATINRVAPTASSDPERLLSRPGRLAAFVDGREKDLPPGQKLVACFRPFLEALVGSDLSRKTIQKHVDNMWALGGEIIRDLNHTPSLRKVAVERLLADRVEDGGPLLYHSDSEEQQTSFESTCRKFRRFLSQSAR